MTVGSLYSGVGGFEIAAERVWGAGCVRWQVEKDPHAQAVLRRHWPDVPRFSDVRELTGDELERVDVVTAGVPCQPVSLSGAGKGAADERWLWPDTLRLLGKLRPRFAVLENPPALFVRGFGAVLGGLAEIGFDAEWSVLSGCRMGAPHARERLFILAYPAGGGWDGWRSAGERPALLEPRGCGAEPGRRWAPESRPCGVAHGVRNRAHRLRGVGNAVMPDVAEWVFRRLERSLV